MSDSAADILASVIRQRHSWRVEFDPGREVPESDLARILEAARWAPTPHNMQNFALIVVKDPQLLARIGAIPAPPSAAFLAENCAQLSFSEEELQRKGTGLMATNFPPSWRRPYSEPEHARQIEQSSVSRSLRGASTLLVLIHDSRKRAPGSLGDRLGTMGAGCVMQNMWLMAESLGIGVQVLSAYDAQDTQQALRALLEIPAHMNVAFACRLGYAVQGHGQYLRVRRGLYEFVHRERYDHSLAKYTE